MASYDLSFESLTATFYFCYAMVYVHLSTPAILHIRHMCEAKDNIKHRMRHGPALNQLHWMVIRFDFEVNFRSILSPSLQFSAKIYPTYSHLHITSARARTPQDFPSSSLFHPTIRVLHPYLCSIPTWRILNRT